MVAVYCHLMVLMVEAVLVIALKKKKNKGVKPPWDTSDINE